MDAHYDIVMKARAEAVADRHPARHYFAYSTILDRAAFLEWRGQHGYEWFDLPAGQLGRALDVALVYDFPSRWWGGRVAGLDDAAGGEVHGVLMDIAGVDWPVVQHKEGAVTGMSVERAVRVQLASGEVVEATAFATSPARRRGDGPVSERFVEALERGARSAGLPAPWIDGLRAGAR